MATYHGLSQLNSPSSFSPVGPGAFPLSSAFFSATIQSWGHIANRLGYIGINLLFNNNNFRLSLVEMSARMGVLINCITLTGPTDHAHHTVTDPTSSSIGLARTATFTILTATPGQDHHSQAPQFQDTKVVIHVVSYSKMQSQTQIVR